MWRIIVDMIAVPTTTKIASIVLLSIFYLSFSLGFSLLAFHPLTSNSLCIGMCNVNVFVGKKVQNEKINRRYTYHMFSIYTEGAEMARFNIEMADQMFDELKSVSREQRRAMGDVIKALVYEWLVKQRDDRMRLLQLKEMDGE